MTIRPTVAPARFADRLREVLAATGAMARAALHALGTGRSRPAKALHPAAADLSLATGGRGDGPPDLDELWRDLNRKLGGLFGNKGSPRRPSSPEPGGGPNFQPDLRSAGIGAILIAGVVALIWLGSGFSSSRKASRPSSPRSASTATRSTPDSSGACPTRFRRTRP
jgi:membrane protease subunit HflK